MERRPVVGMGDLDQAPRNRDGKVEFAYDPGIAQAFREGNLGIMDYYRMKNIQADTGMRDTIGRGGPPTTKA